MKAATLARIFGELDSYGVGDVANVNFNRSAFGPISVYVDVSVSDWLMVVDKAHDLDAGEVPAGSAQMTHDLVSVFLDLDGYRLASFMPLASLSVVEDVLQVMGVKRLDSWRAVAALRGGEA